MRLLRNVLQRSLQTPSPGEGGVEYWRRHIIDLMLAVSAVLGLAAYVPSVALSLRVHYWAVAVVDTLAYAWVVVAALSPGWSHARRVGGILVVIYLLSLVLLMRLGTSGSGLLWLGALPVLAAVFLGLRAAVLCWLAALATLALSGWAVATGALEAGGPAAAQPFLAAAWAVNSVNALFLSAITALPIAVLLRGLEHSNLALSREEERFTKVFQLSPEPMAISLGPEGRLLDVNQAWSNLFRWSREEVLGRNVVELGILSADAEPISLRPEVDAVGMIAPRTRALARKDGTRFPAFVAGRVLELEGEVCLLLLVQDLTAQREAEAERLRLETELLHAQKLESLGSLAGGVAHDMNNILTAILSLTSTLQVTHAGDLGLVRQLGTILGAGERGSRLVRALTDFARKGLQDALPVDLNQLIRVELELLRSTTRQKITFAVDLAPGLPLVLGEPSALGGALMNLCVNALDAMPEGGTLGFQTRVGPAGHVEAAITDTGSGMAPAVLARAMEPFFTTKPAGKGTGLGLAMVYGAMQAHGGTVEIRSEPGHGTRVLLRFPALAEGAQAAPAPPEPAKASGAPLRILVVDDDPVIQESLPALLETLGHIPTLAGRGQQALDFLAAGLAVDVVLLDHNMPGLSGAQTLLRLRELRPDLPVILSTGFLEPDVEELAKRIPHVWLLNKPYTLATIRKKLDVFR